MGNFHGHLSWWGLYSAHLHPALALVFIVPFMPGPNFDRGLFGFQSAGVGRRKLAGLFTRREQGDSPLEQFEHDLKRTVDFGLFFFGFANAGVPLTGMSNLTFILLLSLRLGKTIGNTVCALAADRLGYRFPDGVGVRDLIVTGCIAALGLTVALFISEQAFAAIDLKGATKMRALLSVVAAGLSIVLAHFLGVAAWCRDSERVPGEGRAVVRWPALPFGWRRATYNR